MPKVKNSILLFNPRASTAWSKDSAKFGQRMLEKMGWKDGQGLGANNQGITENIKLRWKVDSKGLGFRIEDNEQWVQVEHGFSAVLSRLKEDTNIDSSENGNSNGPISLESKSLTSKSRVHYHKFTRGKDVSRYNQNDLAGILGQNTKIVSSSKSCVDFHSSSIAKTNTKKCSEEQKSIKVAESAPEKKKIENDVSSHETMMTDVVAEDVCDTQLDERKLKKKKEKRKRKNEDINNNKCQENRFESDFVVQNRCKENHAQLNEEVHLNATVEKMSDDDTNDEPQFKKQKKHKRKRKGENTIDIDVNQLEISPKNQSKSRKWKNEEPTDVNNLSKSTESVKHKRTKIVDDDCNVDRFENVRSANIEEVELTGKHELIRTTQLNILPEESQNDVKNLEYEKPRSKRKKKKELDDPIKESSNNTKLIDGILENVDRLSNNPAAESVHVTTKKSKKKHENTFKRAKDTTETSELTLEESCSSLKLLEVSDGRKLTKAERIIEKVRLLKKIRNEDTSHTFVGSNLADISGYGLQSVQNKNSSS